MLTGDLLSQAAVRSPDKAAIICGDTRVGYAELDAAANRFANALIAAGMQKGDRVAIMARNVPRYATVYFGSARAGTVLVNLPTAYAPEELGRVLDKTAARVVVVDSPYQDKVAAVRDGLPALERFVSIGPARPPEFIDIETWLSGQDDTAPVVSIADTDPFAMTFTGGTTGFPKGAVVSHRARVISARISIDAHGLVQDDVIAVVSPLFHAIALPVWFQSAVMLGATSVFQPSWDAGEFIDLAERDRVTAVLMVPQQIRRVLDHPSFDADRLAGLRTFVSGGATLPLALAARIRRDLPHVALLDDYGQSETGPLAVLRAEDMSAKAGTIGRPVAGVELAIVDAHGSPVPTGHVGELVTRGDHLMRGYFDDPEETAAYFRNGDGWGWTGDLARMDSDGFITLVGRSKEMIVSGGENIYPREVERVLENHPAVAACAVVGIPDDTWGEALAAFIVRRPNATLADEEVRTYCADRLARFKRPSVVRFLETLPITGAGKVRKDALRDAYLRSAPSGRSPE